MIQSHEELDAYNLAFEAAMRIFKATKRFPREETYSLTDQIRRSSRSVCAETQTWLRFAVECSYLSPEIAQELRQTYDHIIGKLVKMIVNPKPWLLVKRSAR
jgi:hypothetical protein